MMRSSSMMRSIMANKCYGLNLPETTAQGAGGVSPAHSGPVPGVHTVRSPGETERYESHAVY